MLQKKIDGIIDQDSEDSALFLQYKSTNNVNIRNAIVSKYLYLAEIMAKKFANRNVDYDDLYQVASVALIKAVERFDPSKGVKFTTFATPTMIGEIKRFFRDKSFAIRLPRRIYEAYQKVNEAKDTLTQKLKRTPRVDEIADFLNISEETVLEIMESWNVYNIQSFEGNVFDDEDTEFHETIGSDDKTFEKIENNDFLSRAMENFSDLEKEFIKMRYYNEKTQKQIADKFGVSQMYVSRLEKKVMEKFRKMLAK